MCSSKNQSQSFIWRPWEETQASHSQVAPRECYKIRCTEPTCKGKATFKRESELRRHTQSKHLKRYERCRVCRKVFTRKDNLTRHVKLAHSLDKKPSCKFCFKSLSRKDAVQRHESTCSKNPVKRYPTHMERIRLKHQKSQQSFSVSETRTNSTKTDESG